MFATPIHFCVVFELDSPCNYTHAGATTIFSNMKNSSEFVNKTMVKRVIQFMRDAWLMLGISLLLCVVLEVVCWLTLLIVDRNAPPDPRNPDVRAKAEAYRNVSWGDDYFMEFNESFDARWEPYEYWRRKVYNGKFITIDTNGLRVTPNSGHGTERAARIFMFGGSTMWGTGARNSFTIPALLATELISRGMRVDVVNFGESGLVTTQEVIILLRQLQKGDVPDLVVYYDGINDTYSAYQQGVAGLPQNESNRVLEFNLTKRMPDLRRMAVKDAFDQLAIVRLTKRILSIERTESKPEYNARVAEEAVNVYLKNMELVQALARSYGFKCYFFWQPTLFGKSKRSDYEKAEYESQQHLEKFFYETYRVLREKTTPTRGDKTFQNLSDIFLHEDEPVYIDWMHLSEKGNAIIAHEMAENIFHLFPSYLSRSFNEARRTVH